MGAQVHFLGLEATHTEVFSSLLRRDGAIVAARRDPIPLSEVSEEGYEIPAAQWARMVGNAARELIEESGVPTTRIWGYAPVAPPGWICLDVQWSPMGDLHLVKPDFHGRIAEAIDRFLSADSRRRSRVGLILAPKDYLRFHWGRVIATDASDAASLGLLSAGARDWSAEHVARYELDAAWLPPVLPAAFACGRVGPAGMETTSLQSSAWAAVGSTTLIARMAACGFVDIPALYLFAHDPTHGYWYGAAGTGGTDEAELTQVLSAPLDELPSHIHTGDTPILLDWLDGEDPERIVRWAQNAGGPVFTAPFAGGISPGAAVLALLASGTYASRESFYRRFARPHEFQ